MSLRLPATLLATLALLGGLLAPRDARACAACGCGDPTLTVMGVEKPFAGRLRAGITATHRSDAIGVPGVDEIRLWEERLDVAATYAPVSWLTLSVSMPLVFRRLTYATLRRESFVQPGDAEVRLRFVLWQDSPTLATHMLSLVGGVKVPTGPVRTDPQGAALPTELQPGSGSFDPLGAIQYAYFGATWSGYASLSASAPSEGTAGSRASRSVRGTGRIQYQATDGLAVRVGPDLRLDGVAELRGAPEPDSGGFIAFASVDVVASPIMDLLLTATLHVPVVNQLLGQHHEGPAVVLGVLYDF